jgi:hypothetical protein
VSARDTAYARRRAASQAQRIPHRGIRHFSTPHFIKTANQDIR